MTHITIKPEDKEKFDEMGMLALGYLTKNPAICILRVKKTSAHLAAIEKSNDLGKFWILCK